MLFPVDCSAGGGRRTGHGEGHRSCGEGTALGVHRLDPHLDFVRLPERQAPTKDILQELAMKPIAQWTAQDEDALRRELIGLPESEWTAELRSMFPAPK